MRSLSKDERELIDRRKREFDSFLEERMPVLVDFVQQLELPNAPLVLVEAENYLAAIDQWLKYQIIDASDKTWILTRLGYFTGEYLTQRLGGYWFLNEVPDSKYFAHFVVGRFARVSNANAMIEPFLVAATYIAEPQGRSFLKLLTAVEYEIVQA